MQISHSFLRTGEAKCSSCIEVRGKPHSKVVSRRECVHSPCRQDIYMMEGDGFGDVHIDRRLDRRAYARRSRRLRRSPFAFAGGAPSKAGRWRFRAFRRTLVGRDALNKDSPLKDPVKTHLGAFYDPFLGRKKPTQPDERRAAYLKTRFKPTERPSKGLQTVHRRKYNRPSKGLNRPSFDGRKRQVQYHMRRETRFAPYARASTQQKDRRCLSEGCVDRHTVKIIKGTPFSSSYEPRPARAGFTFF